MDTKIEKALNEFYASDSHSRMTNGDDLQMQYSPSRWANRLTPETIIQHHVENMVSATKSARENLKCETAIRYSDLGDNCLLDIYYPTEFTKGTQIFIFIHGGYWQECSRDVSGHGAKVITSMGAIYIGIGYDLCPRVSLHKIVEEIQEAFQFIRHRFPYTAGVHIMGHSAGAHLATMVLAQPAHDFPSLLPITIYPVSGIFDLRPLLETDINNALKLKIGDAERLSPMDPTNFKKIYANARQTTRFIILVAENDSPAFHDQSIRFYEMLKATGVNADFLEIKDTDHFDVVERSTDPNYLINKVIQEHITPV